MRLRLRKVRGMRAEKIERAKIYGGRKSARVSFLYAYKFHIIIRRGSLEKRSLFLFAGIVCEKGINTLKCTL